MRLSKAPRPLLSGCVDRISENFPQPVLECQKGAFPFVVQGFHSDNRVAYVDYQVAALLERAVRSGVRQGARDAP